ncbi:uncharacterized protein LOC143250434 [Tachypleus tridentatus]|uniref:uncharacterized protein LOC143250434 n=1 Tax=Tachypleus tridentatus TaxID=6853 RepID=UPI003FD0C36D
MIPRHKRDLLRMFFVTGLFIQVDSVQFTSELYTLKFSKAKQQQNILTTTQAPCSWQCGTLCNRRGECRGFNYQKTTQECQLLEWPNNQVGTVEDASVYFKKISCAALPCENGGTCHEVNNEFRCECSRGWCGVKCGDPHFNVTTDTCIWGYDLVVRAIDTEEGCARKCLQNSLCKSWGFSRDDNYCYVKSVDHTTVSLTPGCYTLSNLLYFYPLKGCVN